MTKDQDKVVMISGANRGIGLAIAEQLATEGYRLSLGVRQPEQFPQPPVESLIYSYQADTPSSAEGWVKATLEHFQAIDIVIHCAGQLLPFHLEDDDESALDQMLEINVKGPLRLTKQALPFLRQSGSGRVISLVSMSGKRIKGQNAGYGISKFAQMALHQSIRNVGWNDGVRATAICPSWVNTDMASASDIEPEAMTQPQDIAQLVSSLLKLPNSAAVDQIPINCNLEFSS